MGITCYEHFCIDSDDSNDFMAVIILLILSANVSLICIPLLATPLFLWDAAAGVADTNIDNHTKQHILIIMWGILATADNKDNHMRSIKYSYKYW